MAFKLQSTHKPHDTNDTNDTTVKWRFRMEG